MQPAPWLAGAGLPTVSGMLLKTIRSAIIAPGAVTAPSTPDIAGPHDRLAALAGGHFRIGSITKTFAATVLLQLHDEGRLALDDPIERYLPGVVPGGERITVRHVLQHTSGPHDYMSEPGYSANRWRGDARFDDYTPAQLLTVACSEGPSFETPGESWRYPNTNYVVAGLLIEKLTGRPYGAEVARRILRPLDLRHTSVPGHRASLPTPHARGYEPLPPTSPLCSTAASTRTSRTRPPKRCSPRATAAFCRCAIDAGRRARCGRPSTRNPAG